MSNIYSKRLETRNFEIGLPKNAGEYSPEKGEITGENIIFESSDFGMPVRSNFIPSHSDKKLNNNNNFTDFDLFDKKTNFNVDYNNLNDVHNNLASFNNNNVNNINNNKNIITDEIQQFSNSIDDYGIFLLNSTQRYLKSSFLLASYNLINILGTLYIASKNKTTQELKNYLNLRDKQRCMTDIQIYCSEIEKLNYCSINNFIIIPYEYQINKTFLNYIPGIKIINYDNNIDPNIEYLKINKYIANISPNNNNIFLNTLKPHHIANKNSIISLISGTIEPIWKNDFDELRKDVFYSYKKREQVYLIANNKNYYYSQNNNMELIELRTFDHKMAFGILLAKEKEDYYPKIETINLNCLIDTLKETQFKYLVIPQIMENLKMRYTNILKESGLKTIFENLEIPEFIANNKLELNDIVQNIYIVINKNNNNKNNNNNNNNKNNNNNNNNISKIIKTPFIYYLRLNNPSTILYFGQFC